MNKFKQLEGLSNKVSIIIPTTKGNKPYDSSTEVHKFLKLFSLMFGGASAFRQQGSWVMEDGSLTIEVSTVVYAYASFLSDTDLNLVYTSAYHLCEDLEQEAIAVEINNEMFFIERG